MAYLDRAKQALVTYKLSAKNVRADIRPGHMLPVDYTGRIEIQDETRSSNPRLTYLSVDKDMWVMKVTRKISDGQITHDFEVATVDRYEMDSTRIVVSLMEAMQAKNISVQTFPFGFQDSSERAIQGNAPLTTPFRDAVFGLQVPDIFTDVVRVNLHVITRPLYTTADVGIYTVPSVPYSSALSYSYRVYENNQYPSDVSLFIDGIDRTTELGGPWNPSAGNSAIDVTLDITAYIVEAAGGLYQDHSLIFKAGPKTAETRVSSSHLSDVVSSASSGMIECKILFFGTARGIFSEAS
jgi:hypothetical protein